MNINNDIFNYNQPINQNYNMNNNQQNYNEQNINKGMNEYVRKELSSYGLNLLSSSPRQIRMEEKERKRILLNNKQSQINLTKKTKLEELRKRQEDAKYLKDMGVSYPFGRGGGGASIRDKSGNIFTNRRALISDPKYNLVQINVSDDYYDVWDKEKRNGRYYKNRSQYNGNNNIPLKNTTQNFGGMNNNQGQFDDPNYGRPYSTNPRLMNNSPQQDYNNMNNNYQNNIQFFNTLQRPNTQNISLTYENYEVIDRDSQRQIKANYRQDLLNQMKENENKKLLEKKEKNWKKLEYKKDLD